jgi:hypothetical protein
MNTEDLDLIHSAGTVQNKQWQLPDLPQYSEIQHTEFYTMCYLWNSLQTVNIFIHRTEVLANVKTACDSIICAQQTILQNICAKYQQCITSEEKLQIQHNINYSYEIQK